MQFSENQDTFPLANFNLLTGGGHQGFSHSKQDVLRSQVEARHGGDQEKLLRQSLLQLGEVLAVDLGEASSHHRESSR